MSGGLGGWRGWTTGVAERISERPSSVPTHDDLTMEHTLHLHTRDI
jgi:hypothetical protein